MVCSARVCCADFLQHHRSVLARTRRRAPSLGADGGNPNAPQADEGAIWFSVLGAFIECLQDQAIPLSLQRSMQTAQPCDPVQILDCDHSPFYSDPAGLAACLKALGLTAALTKVERPRQ